MRKFLIMDLFFFSFGADWIGLGWILEKMAFSPLGREVFYILFNTCWIYFGMVGVVVVVVVRGLMEWF